MYRCQVCQQFYSGQYCQCGGMPNQGYMQYPNPNQNWGPQPYTERPVYDARYDYSSQQTQRDDGFSDGFCTGMCACCAICCCLECCLF